MYRVFKPEEIHVGMKVRVKQLENIMDTYIILLHAKQTKDKRDVEGRIASIGVDPQNFTDNTNCVGPSVVCIYNDSYEDIDDTDEEEILGWGVV